MLAPRPILCPIDFSDPSRQALRWAATIARHRGAGLTVLSVIEPLLARAAGIRLGVDLVNEEAEPALRGFVDEALPERVRLTVPVRLEVRVGDAPEQILLASRSRKPGLIVMGTQGRGGLRKLLLGSTTEEVLRRTEWPVLAIPARAAEAPVTDQPPGQLGTILLATDFREGAMAAAQWAGDLAADTGVHLVLAHVVEPVVVPKQWQALVAYFEKDRVASATRMLATLAANLRDAHPQSVVSIGHPADTIASLAVEHGADLVVMGLANPDDTKPRRPGSIAYRVLRTAHVAVVVVPAPAAIPVEPDLEPELVAAVMRS